ncbi:MAG TPA: endonuclease III, partial [Thermoplasmataceae archaeon]|nr:endonuclease III [Thermoplasmataceae archaeon]
FLRIYPLIQEQSPPHHFEFRDPFWVLITTMLSHRTKDEVTDAAARSLHNRYGSIEGLANADYGEVLSIIDKVGFKRAKAERIIQAARIIRDKFGGRVPESIEALMTIPGVGRKTANVVLSDSMGKPAIAVDTHVHRIANRIGLCATKTPEETEEALRRIIPVEMWVGFNPTLVEFGKHVCKPVGPKCSECKILDYCKFGKKRVKRG